MFIKIIRTTVASGMTVKAGKIYEAPGDISVDDARTLIAMRKAVEVLEVEEEQPEPPAEEVKEEEQPEPSAEGEGKKRGKK